MNFRIFPIIFFIVLGANGQKKYPQDYFQIPLDIPVYLSGTFGELRTNHFHAGIDIKTQQKEGFKVFASAEGYVSRIKISHWGYGKALYITHPNGYTTVYAHLKKFSDKIESYIRKKQYEKESFEIHLFPDETELLVEQGEVVAFSGSTGGFVGPHLHFEIRDSNAKPLNPFLFGIDKTDTKRPIINTLLAYSLTDSSQVNGSNAPIQINFKALENGNLLANKITASGTIGFGVNTIDRLDGALNKNGIYSLEMNVNGKTLYKHVVESFSFAESKYINLHIDYERYANLKQRIQRCFVVPENPLSIYKELSNNGYIAIDEGKTYNVEIIAKDFKGNSKTLQIPVIGKKDSILVFNEEKITPYHIKTDEFSKFSKNGVTVAFPKNTFYNDLYLDFDVKDSIAKIHKGIVPVHKNFTVTFDVSKYTEEEKNQMYIAKLNDKGYASFKQTTKKDNSFYTTTKSLGNYTLAKDTSKPKLRLSNIKNEQWLTNYNYLVLKVSDKGSGLKSYRGEIDGEWILLEYSPKHGTLTYDFSDKKFETPKHHLKVIAIDNAGNTNSLEATFYRKK